MKKTQIILQPIERQEREVKRVKNQWAQNVQYLQDLKNNKGVLTQNLQNDILTLYQEKRSLDEVLSKQDQNQNRTNQNQSQMQILNSVRISLGQAQKMNSVLNEQLLQKMQEIEKCVETPVMMLGITGHQDYRELAQSLFHVLALLEVQEQHFMEVDQAMISNLLFQSNQYISDGFPSAQQSEDSSFNTRQYTTNNNQFRTETYLKLIKEMKIQEQKYLNQIFELQKSNQEISKLYNEVKNQKNTQINFKTFDKQQIKQLELFKNFQENAELINYKKIENDLKKLNQCIMTQDLLDKIFEQLKSYILIPFQQKHSDLIKQDSQYSQTINEKSQIIQKLQQQTQELHLELESLKKQIDSKSQISNQFQVNDQNQVDKYKKQIQKHEEDIKQLKLTIIKLKSEIELKSKDVENLKDQIKVFQNNEIQKQNNIEQLQQEKEDLKCEYDEIQIKFNEIYRSEQSFKTDFNNLKKEQEKYKLQMQSQAQIFQDISEKYLKLKSQVESSISSDELKKKEEQFIQIQEQVKSLNEILNTKIIYIAQLQVEISKLNEQIAEHKEDLSFKDEHIERLEESLRKSGKGFGRQLNDEDSFEAVLRKEFEQMRKKYEKRVDELRDQAQILKRDFYILKAEKEKDQEEFKQSKLLLGDRLIQIRFKYEELLAKERLRDAQEHIHLLSSITN